MLLDKKERKEQNVLGQIRVQLVQITEADVVAFADGAEVLHVTVRKQRLKLVAG